MELSPSVSLTFSGTCEAAFHEYERVLGGKVQFILKWDESPMAQDAPPDFRKKILYARMAIGNVVLVGGDVLPDHYVQPSGFNLMLSVENRAEGERLFNALAEGGNARMPLQETFWSSGYGQVTDRFGIPWEINCERGQ